MVHILTKATAGLLAMAVVQACASLVHQSPPPTQLDITGHWDGISVAYCSTRLWSTCDGVDDISFTLFQNGLSATGAYYRVPENRASPHFIRNGAIHFARMHGNQVSLRVSLPNGSSCIFLGLFKSDTARGGYFCYQGGGLVGEGVWRARRTY